ncbi:MAG: chromosome segregation protein SMC [Acidimicrobiia bacterium]
MYLKTLKLVGFKSFADRTRLEFRPGVTVVVGPNGSGKSNLVDALSWVMGTQSTKALRTGKMEDVVFAGTATRPALNRAEATLVIDNGERLLPLDLDEVSLTRRLYRDGSSDYEINGMTCRLLDIQELLSDSGVGRHQHVIIGQGQVDGVLNASPEDHRAIIEEAAGILKHRRRKEKAERRLERTDEDLLRLRDLTGEMERQLRPLRRQARAAERYDGLKAEVRGLKLYLSGIALESHDREMTTVGVSLEELRHSIAGDEQAVEGLQGSIDGLTAKAADLAADLDRDTTAAAVLETTVERVRRLGAVAHERSRAVSGRREASVERRADLEMELGSIRSELVEIRSEEISADSEVASREAEFRRLEDRERSISTQHDLSPEGALAAVRGELAVLQASALRDGREKDAVDHRIEVVASQLNGEIGEIGRINDEVRRLDEGLGLLQSEYGKSTRGREGDQQRWEAAESGLTEAKMTLAGAEARTDAVKAALSGRFDLGARRSIEGSSGALGSLVSLLDIPDGLERAVDAALGRWVDSVVFVDGTVLRQAVELVKTSGGGGVPLINGSGDRVEGTASAMAGKLGVTALVDQLGPDANRNLANRLLGDVLLVEGWAGGWSLVTRHPHLRAVTPEGDLIDADGIQISHPDGAGPAMLEAAEVAVERARTELSRATSIHVAARRDFETSREKERSDLERLEAAEAELAGKTEAMARLQQSVDALESERQRLRQRMTSLQESATARSDDIDELTRRLRSLEGEEADRARVWEELQERRDRMAGEKESARSAWHDSAAGLHGLIERRRLLEERLAHVAAELGRSEADQPGAPDTDRLERVVHFAQRAVEVLQRRVSELRDRQSGLRAENQRIVAELGSKRAEHDALGRSLSVARERVGEMQVRLTELRLTRESLAEGVRRDADCDPEDAYGAPRPDYPDDTDLEAMLDEKAAQLRRLGPINPLAAAEYAELDERYQFLLDQMRDVESSRSELRKVIRALDAEIEDRFRQAFGEVETAYQRYFSLLFPGGRGRIRLTDPDDPHSGVIIDAQPLGKKVSQLSLLSGGERSLAALAFLFSVFEARPSPFYVLDEVEAALDDANLRRFLRIVDEFRQRAQLLVVTHQQQTMEAADVLYGVTMEPGGSSQVVRKDMAAATSALSG